MCDFHSIVHNYTTNTMSTLLSNIQSDPQKWNNSIYFKPAYDNIKYFSKFTNESHLLNIPSKNKFQTLLKQAMFNELTSKWKNHLLARHTYRIVPIWKPQLFSRNNYRYSEGYYIRLAFKKNDTRISRHRFNPSIDIKRAVT